ncbi:acetyltransferase GNAT family [Fusarium albosuccineum]|uniref:Acetyltransferase GNAT family n=1 Tax=Fusarium albosuccineum TaxID=1237068 RepID=A0A8H4L1T3_9HYPO|nr:acetyltransferase GNAT family [Fusarium albosuccineum]
MIRVRQTSPQDLPYIQDIMFSALIDSQNYIISSFMPRRDMDGAHYNAFFTALKEIDDNYWRPSYPEALHLQAFYRHSEAWGKGVGTTLIEWGLDAALKAQVPVVVESTGAAKFYENRGFKQVCTKRIQVEGESAFVDVDALVWVPLEVEAL